ncbi:MAG: hypothetical protein JXB39_08440 [Deltaproteobacteria bacterium]|nr:hypothetical protein [Deltaproteobacteria bacterium]
MRRVGPNRRGVAVTEYVLVLGVLVVGLVGTAWVFLPAFREGVSAVGSDLGGLLAGQGRPSIRADTPVRSEVCPYTFDPRTGRWHDTERDYLMVSFAEAAAHGC